MEFRGMTEEDLPWFNKVRNESREFLHDNREFTLEQTQEWFKSLPADRYYTVIHYGQFRIGYFRFRKYSKTCIEIGADLDKTYQGRGHARRAYIEMINLLFKEGAECITLEVLANNTRAYTLYRSLGFGVNGDSLITDVIRGRERIASLVMDLNKENWNAHISPPVQL